MSVTQPGTVRVAQSADAEAMARVHVAAWRETYSGIFSEANFSVEALRRRERMWTAVLSTSPCPWRAAVAELDGSIVGIAAAGAAVGPDAERGSGAVRDEQVHILYLLQSAHGTGLGQALLDAVIGARPAQLWVLQGNDRAIQFYERNGFVADGAEFVDPGEPGVTECRMVR